MTPDKGQHVKCVFHNGTVVEGIVEDWSLAVAYRSDGSHVSNVVLRSLDDKSQLIIPHPETDIMLIKVMLEEASVEVEDKPLNEATNELEEKFIAQAEATDPHDIDGVKSLAQLRIDLNKQEREIIAAKLREHRPTPYKSSTTPYHYPPVIMKDKSAYKPARIPDGQPRPNKK